jgi:2'-5' RNA ligase
MSFGPDDGWESALVVPVAAAEPLVTEWRMRFDPAARWGVPAHITVLYPFVPPDQIDETTLVRLRDLLDGFGSFEFTLVAVDRFDTDVLYLRPEPPNPFSALTAAIVEEWPEHQPYGGIHDEVIPHLTVAYQDVDGRFDQVTADVVSHMPIPTRAEIVSPMAGRQLAGSWRTLEAFALEHVS